MSALHTIAEIRTGLAALISPGRANTMIELYYDGYRRLIEPYKLKYYVRKKDGRGLEYFWGWDTTGGKSGKIGSVQNLSHI